MGKYLKTKRATYTNKLLKFVITFKSLQVQHIYKQKELANHQLDLILITHLSIQTFKNTKYDNLKKLLGEILPTRRSYQK